MAYCSKCGKYFPDDTKFCPECGTMHPVSPQTNYGCGVTCPNCKGSKLLVVGENNYQCAYCGTFFSKPLPPPSPVVQPNIIYVQPPAPPPAVHRPNDKDKTTALLLCFFFGVLGIHKFYLRETVAGVVYLLLSCLCFVSVIPATVDFFILLFQSEYEFNVKYNNY